MFEKSICTLRITVFKKTNTLDSLKHIWQGLPLSLVYRIHKTLFSFSRDGDLKFGTQLVQEALAVPENDGTVITSLQGIVHRILTWVFYDTIQSVLSWGIIAPSWKISETSPCLVICEKQFCVSTCELCTIVWSHSKHTINFLDRVHNGLYRYLSAFYESQSLEFRMVNTHSEWNWPFWWIFFCSLHTHYKFIMYI